MWRTRFGRDFGPVVRENTKWMNELLCIQTPLLAAVELTRFACTKTPSDGTSQQDLAVQFRRDRAQTTIIYISFSYYHELKLVRLKHEVKGVLYQQQTYSLFYPSPAMKQQSLTCMHNILLDTTCKQIILLEKLWVLTTWLLNSCPLSMWLCYTNSNQQQDVDKMHHGECASNNAIE